MSVMIVTNLGDLALDLYTARCPLTCKTFLKLCRIKYYHGCLFHTVWKDFTAQTGDPTRTGFGGDSIYKFLYGDQARFFGDEIHSDLKHSKRRSMIGPMDEQLGAQELHELLCAKQAHSRSVVLESIGDIPDAEMKPPDNVLFVCRLNPATEEEELYIIFSRFGTVTSAEIIRDHKTGNSLCYAFIEFEDKKTCEQAYFKMDNTQIDDRRIHVDFSQSVAKLWSQYRRREQIGNGCFNNGSVDAIKQQWSYLLKEDNKQHDGDGNSKYSKFLRRTRKERRKHKGRKPLQITKSR
ncbi:hypothetical protein HAX54_006661 [Datura stramonium]|uniref:peptidylprolyl isomerase n=1 Tax=Datura stramonium TaxID=4076 RepID=A0ABS8TAQ3_DATST|nr:hypothetical protein [Datura stramonium]